MKEARFFAEIGLVTAVSVGCCHHARFPYSSHAGRAIPPRQPWPNCRGEQFPGHKVASKSAYIAKAPLPQHNLAEIARPLLAHEQARSKRRVHGIWPMNRAHDQAGFTRRCFVALRFIAGRSLPAKPLLYWRPRDLALQINLPAHRGPSSRSGGEFASPCPGTYFNHVDAKWGISG